MYCKKCGSIIDNDSVFCSSCGTRQKIVSQIDSTSLLKSEPISETQTVNVNLTFGKPSISTQNSSTNTKKQKYDPNYHKETEATKFGIALLIVTFLIIVFGDTILSSNESIAPIFSLIGIAIRIITTLWVVNIAGRQNRNKTNWGILSFLFPSITLIIIGLSKKINTEVNNDESILQDYNFPHKKIKTNNGMLIIKLSKSSNIIIGDDAFLNGRTAPDGKYIYGKAFWNEYIIVKNGKITRI